jgi:transcriptional regulator with XRE-family HTH domain
MWNDILMTVGEATPDPKALARLIGERVRRLRRQRGWSLSSLAVRAGLGKATLSEIESGQRNPTLETLYAIAAQLQIGLSELLTEATSPGHGPGVIEHLFMTAGTVRVGPLGRPVEISAGADWSWESSSSHSYTAIGDRAAEAVLVIRHPVKPA